MPQNIYDSPEFFEGYSQFPRSKDGLAAAPEWPAVRAMLPELAGASVLDLGCGFGAFARWAADQRAAQVIGVDLSKRMLARARELTESDRVRYVQGDFSFLGNVDSIDGTFDLIYSALAFHYIEDFHKLCRQMRERLVAGGKLVATVEHPLYTAPARPEWQSDEDGLPIWPLNNYRKQGQRVTNWIAPGVIKYHRTIEGYITALVENGFILNRLVEWGPDEAQLREHPEWAREAERPMFMLFSAEAQ